MYSAVEDILKLLPESEVLQLADDDHADFLGAPAVAAVLAEAINQADREIDAYVGVVHAVPLNPAPALIANLSTKLAIHNLWLRRSNVEEPEHWQRETARVMRLLEAVATGKMALGVSEIEPETPPSGPSPSFQAGERLMSRRTL